VAGEAPLFELLGEVGVVYIVLVEASYEAQEVIVSIYAQPRIRTSGGISWFLRTYQRVLLQNPPSLLFGAGWGKGESLLKGAPDCLYAEPPGMA
jgi:hypothetical protein